MVAPFAQYFALAHIRAQADELSHRLLDPGIYTIASALYTLYILTQDHTNECLCLHDAVRSSPHAPCVCLPVHRSACVE